MQGFFYILERCVSSAPYKSGQYLPSRWN